MPTPEQPPEVLGRFCHGDLDAFEVLFRGDQNEVYRWIVRDPAAAEDLTARNFLAHLSGACPVQPSAGLRAVGTAHRH